MKVYAFSYRLVAWMTVVNAVLLILLLFVSKGVFSDNPRFERGLDVFAVVCIAIGVARLWRLPGKCWVRVDARGVGWRTNDVGLRNGCSPDGAVALGDVSAVHVVTQDRILRPGKEGRTDGPGKPGKEAKVYRGYAVQLVLVDGSGVVLPIYSTATRIGPALTRLIEALRAHVPSTVAIETALIAR